MTYSKVLSRRQVLAGTAGAAAMVAMGRPAQAQTVVLRYNQWFPTAHWSQSGGLYKWFEQVKEVTGGRVVVEPSAKPLAPPNRNYQAVVDGIADLAWGPHGYAPGVFPLTELVELPFITKHAGVSSVAYWRLWKEKLEPTGMQKDVVTLAMHLTAGGNIHMNNSEIRTAKDLAGKKMRVPTPVVGRVLQKMGAVPINGSLNELREMMSRGIIDGTAISSELTVGFKVDKFVKSVTEVPGGIFANSAFIIVSSAKWKQISPDDQKAILAISGEPLSRFMGDLWQKFDDEAKAAYRKDLGAAYIDASPDFIKALQVEFEGEQTAWLNQAKGLGLDGKAALDFYQAQIASVGN
ncbi:ABC transporter substrate-binding protein [Rhizobium sp. Root149]|uniref:TRAP transporter substrate-binding protein n=1 Tax=Rhizobium sp. Root149 TaxID=1736473 RepID=UPI000715554B|nr:TRAP transporter substrate-binding protein [Rhizobium sp. Root149]KQZ57923.1 ABC transporter substrate-binding protein [Rhizobium sp. Root149]